MLYQLSRLSDCPIQTGDGDRLGLIEDTYFDDQTWTVRYLAVDTKSSGTGRRVLVAPEAVSRIDLDGRNVLLDLTTEQLESCPSVETHQPVTRQHEMQLRTHFGWPIYWPQGAEETRSMEALKTQSVAESEPEDRHLQSAADVAGYHVKARDEELGHIEDFLVDETSWVIHYLLIDTANWWPGKHVVIPPGWVQAIDWEMSTAQVDHTSDEIRSAPKFEGVEAMNRRYEEQLHQHYNRPPYWE